MSDVIWIKPGKAKTVECRFCDSTDVKMCRVPCLDEGAPTPMCKHCAMEFLLVDMDDDDSVDQFTEFWDRIKEEKDGK